MNLFSSKGMKGKGGVGYSDQTERTHKHENMSYGFTFRLLLPILFYFQKKKKRQ